MKNKPCIWCCQSMICPSLRKGCRCKKYNKDLIYDKKLKYWRRLIVCVKAGDGVYV